VGSAFSLVLPKKVNSFSRGYGDRLIREGEAE
jgi:hypothetical protein